MSISYKQQSNEKALNTLITIKNRLPKYCRVYLNSLNTTLAPKSRLGYARDLEIFMDYLKRFDSDIDNNTPIYDIPLSSLARLRPEDIDGYLDYLSLYTYNGKEYKNDICGKKRKLTAVRELYRYLCKIDYLSYNPAALIRTPKDDEKSDEDIRALDYGEKINLFEEFSKSENLSKKQLEMKNLLEIRDTTIFLLFLGTGIRLSELVGLDINDLGLSARMITTIPKGKRKSKQKHYFNETIKEYMILYLRKRNELKPEDNENALFLSRRGTRINIRTVEVLIKKYSERAFGEGNGIHPHILRSTYGTSLYESTGDIVAVKNNLGHSDISTSKHYVKKSERSLLNNREFNMFATDDDNQESRNHTDGRKNE